MMPQTFGERIRQIREERKLPLRKVSDFTGIDSAVLSKIERNQRMANRRQFEKLAEYFNLETKDLIMEWLSDKLIYELGNEKDAIRVLQVAEDKIKYKSFLKIDRKDIIKRIKMVIKKYSGIEKAWICGSFSREDDDPESDIDLAFKTSDSFSYFDLAEVQYELEKIINRKIDTGFIDSFKPYIFENIKSDLRLIYEKE